MKRVAVACLFSLLGAACEKKEEKPAEPPAAAAPAAPTAAKPAEPAAKPGEPAGSASPAGLVGGGKMQHCPTAVAGAETTINSTPDSVEIVIVGKDQQSAKDILADAKHLKEVAMKEQGAPKHTGEGEGGGGLGKCPVVLKDTLITITEVPGGAKIALKPTKPEQLDWLKKEVESRHAKLKTP